MKKRYCFHTVTLIAAGVLLTVAAVESSASLLPLPGIFPIHRGIVASVTTYSAFEAVVKLEIQKGDIEYSRCTGTFISDRHVLTAAHCLEGGRRAYLYIPHANGFWEPGPSTEFHLSEDNQDLAIVQFPPRTFTGRPFDFRIQSEGLLDEINAEANRVFTLGYGRTETGRSSDQLLYLPLGEVGLSNQDDFVTKDLRRVDVGDSGGPVILLRPSGEAAVVAVNHAYEDGQPEIQFFKPLVREFFETALEAGFDLPAVTCDCSERIRYVRSTTSLNGRRARRLRSWQETVRESHREFVDGFEGCAEFESAPSEETYPGEFLDNGTPTTILRRSAGMSCEPRRPGFRPATLRGL